MSVFFTCLSRWWQLVGKEGTVPMAPPDRLLTPYKLTASELAICRGGYDFTTYLEVEGNFDEC